MPFSLQDPQGKSFPVGTILHIGCQATNEIVLTDPLASPIHATIWEQQGVVYVRDENTAAGTFVNDARVQVTVLSPGDTIRIGSSTFVLQPGAPPGLVVPSPHPTAKKKAGGCWKVVLAGCLAAVVSCGVLGLGGWLAYRAGLITPEKLMNLVGLGPADIEVDNLREDSIAVSIEQLDVPADSVGVSTSWEMSAFDIRAWRAADPGRYQFSFGTADGLGDLGVCTLTLRSGDRYQFAALPEVIVVSRAGHPPAEGADLIVSTSALCR